MKKITIQGITGLGVIQLGTTYITESFYMRLVKKDILLPMTEEDCYIDGKTMVAID